jgi:hypothetical protein
MWLNALDGVTSASFGLLTCLVSHIDQYIISRIWIIPIFVACCCYMSSTLSSKSCLRHHSEHWRSWGCALFAWIKQTEKLDCWRECFPFAYQVLWIESSLSFTHSLTTSHPRWSNLSLPFVSAWSNLLFYLVSNLIQTSHRNGISRNSLELFSRAPFSTSQTIQQPKDWAAKHGYFYRTSDKPANWNDSAPVRSKW